MRDWLIHKLAPSPEDVDDMLARGSFVDDQGKPWTGREIYRPHTFVWFHRELRDEAEVPGELTVLHQDERIVVLDKPHFLSTIPRGRHVVQSAVVKARQALGLPELSAAHRLDRGTAGVLLMTTEKRWRAAYHSVFTERTATKVYRAIAPFDASLTFPRRVESHLIKRVGTMQAETLPREPNAFTDIHLLEVRGQHALYEVHPLTGKTHQIRAHFNQLGIPLLGDPLYPEVLPTEIDDFSTPLRLLAYSLAFPDPIDGAPRRFVSTRNLMWG
ncbi:MAG: pseudouridine synthase [Propionibacteriaceae bacterium]|nr:pseudouridine synthase [Propionibacteriaceae bacterium]